MDVLYPEGLHLIIMDMFKLSRKEVHEIESTDVTILVT